MGAERNYLIAYDLISPGQKYEAVAKAIAECCSWRMKLQYSLFYGRSSMTADQIYAHIQKVMDVNDKLAVIEANNAVVTIPNSQNRADFVSLWRNGVPASRAA